MAIKDTGLSTPGIRSEFLQRFSEVNKSTYWADLVTVLQGRTKTETYKFLGSVPQLRAWGTGRVAKGLIAESYSVSDEKYEATLEVDREEIEDDQTGQIKLRVRELADRAATHKDKLVGELLKNGATAGFNSYDGVTFFNANHVSGNSGAQDNTLAPAITDKDNPTAAEFQAAFGSAVARLLSFKDDQGEVMSMGSQGLVVIVPPSMMVVAATALNATIVGQTTNVLQGAARVLTFPQLSDTDTWYLAKVDMAIRPFILQDRIPLEFTALEGDSEEGFKRDKWQYGVRARYAMTYGYWQYAVKIGFTTA